MIYSIEPREYLLKAMTFCLLLKNNGKNRGEMKAKLLIVNIVKNALKALKYLGRMHLKLLHKE